MSEQQPELEQGSEEAPVPEVQLPACAQSAHFAVGSSSGSPQTQENQAVTTIEELRRSVSPNVVRFAEHYAATHNGILSGRLAGFSAAGHSYPYVLLKDPRVQALVEHFEAVLADQSTMTPSKLVRRWAMMANINLLDYVTDDYELKPLSALTDDQREHLGLALTAIEVQEKAGRRRVKAKFAIVEAMENLGKLLRLYGDEKQAGDGLTLNITVGHPSVLAEEGAEEDLGHLTIRVPRDAPGT